MILLPTRFGCSWSQAGICCPVLSTTFLQLQHNQLSTLPVSFGDIFSLEFLDISHNDFAVMPDCITDLPRLRVLYAHGNGCTTLPDDFGRLRCLEHLNVRYVSSFCLD
jgi:Leucine-rich repeat (LRR) protein